MTRLFKAGLPKIIPEFTGLQVNTAVQVLPIPIIYGCPRISVNLIYYNGFNVQKVNVGGGKGILSGGKGPQEIEYFATIIIALGEGTLGNILAIYQDQGVYTTSDYPSPGLNYFFGTDTQAPWSYVVSKWPTDARSYKDTAYIAVANAQLDASATVPQINLVVQGLLTGTCPLNHSTITITSGQYDVNGNPVSFLGPIILGDADADPSLTIYDILTNIRYGAGFPIPLIETTAGNLGSILSGPNATNLSVGDPALQTYCQAAGFGWSLVLDNVESCNSLIDRLTKNMAVAPVWTGELLKFIPYWDQPTQSNPNFDSANPGGLLMKYYVPVTAPIAAITTDHILQAKNNKEQPIALSRTDPMLVYNTVRVDYRDRTNFFNDNVAEAKDEAQIQLYGERVDNISLADEYTLGVYAKQSATVQLRRNVSVRNKYTFRLSPLWAFLDPMDIVQIPDPTNWSSAIDVRIISAEDDENEITTYNAEQFPLGGASPTFLPQPITSPPNQGPTNIPSGSVFTPVIFEPTTAMLNAVGDPSPVGIIGASGGRDGVLDPYYGGAAVYVSFDGLNYERIGSITGPSAVGLLAATLPAFSGSNPDTVDSLVVNMSESGVNLASFPSSVAAAGVSSLCIVKDVLGFELLSYKTATLSGTNTFTLTTLYRGLYSTSARAFSAGSQFLFLGSTGNFLQDKVLASYVGQTIWIKLPTFNAFNNFSQSLADAVAYQYTITGPTLAPLNYGFVTRGAKRRTLDSKFIRRRDR